MITVSPGTRPLDDLDFRHGSRAQLNWGAYRPITLDDIHGARRLVDVGTTVELYDTVALVEDDAQGSALVLPQTLLRGVEFDPAGDLVLANLGRDGRDGARDCMSAECDVSTHAGFDVAGIAFADPKLDLEGGEVDDREQRRALGDVRLL